MGDSARGHLELRNPPPPLSGGKFDGFAVKEISLEGFSPLSRTEFSPLLPERERNSPPGRGKGWVESFEESDTPEPTPNPSQEGSSTASPRKNLPWQIAMHKGVQKRSSSAVFKRHCCKTIDNCEKTSSSKYSATERFSSGKRTNSRSNPSPSRSESVARRRPVTQPSILPSSAAAVPSSTFTPFMRRKNVRVSSIEKRSSGPRSSVRRSCARRRASGRGGSWRVAMTRCSVGSVRASSVRSSS